MPQKRPAPNPAGNNGKPHITDEQRAQMDGLQAAGMGRNEIARQVGISLATVTKHFPPGTFDRAATEAATKAKVADAADRRVNIALRELDITELIQANVIRGLKGEGFSKLVKSGSGAERTETLDYIPAGDLQQLSNSRSSSVTIIKRLTGEDDSSAEDREMLLQISAALGPKAPAADDDDDE